MTHIERNPMRRRSFIVGASATGLAFGYVAGNGSLGGIKDALAANSFGPTPWYAIGPDGLVTVQVGKAEMGQHVSSAMAQIIAEELESDWSKMRIAFPTSDPKFADPVLGALADNGGPTRTLLPAATSPAAGIGKGCPPTDQRGKARKVPDGCTAGAVELP